MLLTYDYKGQSHKVFIYWTADTGGSSVFREIVQRISERHLLAPGDYPELARHLDGLTDKLYEQFYIFTSEYRGVPYNPGFRRRVLRVVSEINEAVGESMKLGNPEWDNVLSGLFADVVDKLTETVDVYLKDNAYQGKHHYRRVNREQYSETTDANLISCEFEDILLQMAELSCLIDCLTDIQRVRFLKHIFLNYTFQEIADHECVTKQSVQESVVIALKKIKQQIE